MKWAEFPQHTPLSSIGHSRASGNPGLFSTESAWIPVFAGMTNPRDRFNWVEIIPYLYFLRMTRIARSSENQLSESFVIFMVRENSPSSAATEDNGSGYLVHGLLAKTSTPR